MEHVGFRRNIGLFLAVMIGIGAMMGPGIFVGPAAAIRAAQEVFLIRRRA